jgi:hypothetical protein
MIYHSLFHSVMSYGIIFGGNSTHSPVSFKIQERVIRILMGSGYRHSCRRLFNELKLSTLALQYISLCCCLLFLISIILPQIVLFITLTPDIKMICICRRYPWLSIKRQFFCTVINAFSALPRPIKHISISPKKFKVALKRYLLAHSFYTVDEFLIEQNI